MLQALDKGPSPVPGPDGGGMGWWLLQAHSREPRNADENRGSLY